MIKTLINKASINDPIKTNKNESKKVRKERKISKKMMIILTKYLIRKRKNI